jgi:hypothetical protein
MNNGESRCVSIAATNPGGVPRIPITSHLDHKSSNYLIVRPFSNPYLFETVIAFFSFLFGDTWNIPMYHIGSVELVYYYFSFLFVSIAKPV